MQPIDHAPDRTGVFAGDDPFAIARRWQEEARAEELNDADAIALSTVDDAGLPNVRMVLLKQILDGGFVFFTNYTSQKAAELDGAGKAAFVQHWKSLRRQIRARGRIERASAEQSDTYFASRSVFSRIGAWASDQSAPLAARAELQARVDQITAELGDNPGRPPFWGGYVLIPSEIEFWCDGANRLHDRFQWRRVSEDAPWDVRRLNP